MLVQVIVVINEEFAVKPKFPVIFLRGWPLQCVGAGVRPDMLCLPRTPLMHSGDKKKRPRSRTAHKANDNGKLVAVLAFRQKQAGTRCFLRVGRSVYCVCVQLQYVVRPSSFSLFNFCLRQLSSRDLLRDWRKTTNQERFYSRTNAGCYCDIVVLHVCKFRIDLLYTKIEYNNIIIKRILGKVNSRLWWLQNGSLY